MITRRHFLALLPPAAISPWLNAQHNPFARRQKPRPAAPELVFFGSDTTHPEAHGIYRSRFDRGHLTPAELAVECVRPSYMALSRVGSKTYLYVANEGDAQHSSVSSYQVDAKTGALNQINQVSSGGLGPCYIAVDADGRSAYVANYAGGTIATYVIERNGALSQPVNVIDFHSPDFGHHGPVAARQDGPHPHSAMLSPEQRFLIVNDLGNDDIVLFPVDTATAKLGTPRVIESRLPGTGPRHVAFHPNGRWVYGIDELANRVDEYLWDSTRGAGAEAMVTDTNRSVSTLDAGFHGTNTAAEIVVSEDGAYVYASNRGENTLVVFHVDPTDGALTPLQRISCGGRTPRHFTLDPSGKWLLCGNQDSDSATVFTRDENSGMLAGPVQTLPVPAPMFTLFV